MAVTVTTAADRDQRRARREIARPAAGDLLLLAISLVAVIAVLFTYAGRLAVLGRTSPGEGGPAAVNLNTMADASGLEAIVALVFADGADRQLAARELFGFVVQADGSRRVLPNVGALARVEVQAAAIDRDSRLSAFSQRLASARARAFEARQPAPVAIPLLTSAELAAIKPYLIVRERGAVLRSLLLWSALYCAAFLAVSLLWRAAGQRGDRNLLAAAHLLTAIGLVAMLARPDPLRDTLLFQRYLQGVIVGLAAMAAVSFIRIRSAIFRDLSYVPLLGALVLCVSLILFGSGPAGSNAKVNLGPVQPVEAIRLLIALFLAGYFARRWELLRVARGVAVRGYALPAWLNAPRLDYVLPLLIGVSAALGLFFIQKDLGPALVVAIVFLIMYAVARSSVVMTTAGFLLLA